MKRGGQRAKGGRSLDPTLFNNHPSSFGLKLHVRHLLYRFVGLSLLHSTLGQLSKALLGLPTRHLSDDLRLWAMPNAVCL